VPTDDVLCILAAPAEVHAGNFSQGNLSRLLFPGRLRAYFEQENLTPGDANHPSNLQYVRSDLFPMNRHNKRKESGCGPEQLWKAQALEAVEPYAVVHQPLQEISRANIQYVALG
jgi:hypothetical protein